MHSRETRKHAHWPRFYGLQYSIPIVNVLTFPIFLLARAEVQRFGKSPFSISRIRKIFDQQRSSITSFYKFAGVVATTYILISILLVGPVDALLPEDSIVYIIFISLTLIIIAFTPVYRRFSPQSIKENIDIALRDIMIRLNGVLGLATTGVILYFIFGTFLAAVVLLFIPQARATEILEIFINILLPLFLIPLAATVVLLFRLIPWIKAIPVALSELTSTAVKFLRKALFAENSDTTPDMEMESNVEYLPVSGFKHTSVEIQAEQELKTEGFFGYHPSKLDEIEHSSVPTSIMYGILFIIPGYLYAASFFVFFELRPKQTTELASVVPGKDLLVSGLAFIGVPRFVVENAIDLAGLPPETISLGLVAIIIPVLLMVPGAWHLALEYEKRTYKSLCRLGAGNHLLLLWVLPFILPFVWGVLRIWNKISNRS